MSEELKTSEGGRFNYRNINKEIAGIFSGLADFWGMREDQFRSRAYTQAASTIGTLTKNLKDVYSKGGLKGLQEISHIGEGMAEKIEEYINTGKIKEYEDFKEETPSNVGKLTSIEGVGSKTVEILYKKLGITNIEELEKAAREGKVREVEGFGKKSEQNILEGIEFVKANTGRMLMGYARLHLKTLLGEMASLREIKNISMAGSLRRMKETIGDIDILAVSDNPQKTIGHFINRPEVIKVWQHGERKSSVRVEGNYDIDLLLIEEGSWGAALQYFTGNKSHNIKVRNIAIENDWKLNEYGLFSEDPAKAGQARIAGRTEKEIYNKLGMSWIEPELRTDHGEIEAVQKGKLPNIAEYEDIKGDLQMHSNWTDGDNSIKEMAESAKELGHSYIAITDHSKTLKMTGGLNSKELKEQAKEIDEVNEEIEGITVLKGSEVEILKDGSLDLDDKTLSQLDLVGAAIHSNFNMGKEEMTERVLKALENPYINILYHPTGRLIQKRKAFEVDIEKVIEKAAKNNVALEINSFPDRLDLKDEHVRIAINKGAKLAINTDSHHKDHLIYIEFGIGQARRGWAQKEDIINTLSIEKLKNFLGKQPETKK